MAVQDTTYTVEVSVSPGNMDSEDEKRTYVSVGGYVEFPGMLGVRLRANLDPAVYPMTDASKRLRRLIGEVGEIPGQMITVDLKKNTLEFWDPLREADEDSPLGRKAEKIRNITKLEFSGAGVKFARRVSTKLRTADDRKTAMFYVARLLESNYARTPDTERDFPSMDDIMKMPGKRRIDLGGYMRDTETAEKHSYLEGEVAVTS